MKDLLLKLKFDMLYRGLSREEAAKRYAQIVEAAAQAAQAAQGSMQTNPLMSK